jgi:hypothetical protein
MQKRVTSFTQGDGPKWRRQIQLCHRLHTCRISNDRGMARHDPG